MAQRRTIIVDTTTKIDDAEAVRAEFAKISRAPVRAIVYTHSHPDHAGGASVCPVPIAPRSTAISCSSIVYPISVAPGRDGGDQFGSTLPARCTSTTVPEPRSGARRVRPR